MSEPDVFTVSVPVMQPGRTREDVFVDYGKLIGHLDSVTGGASSEDAGLVKWLPCTARWDAVGDRSEGFPDRQSALDALVEAVRPS